MSFDLIVFRQLHKAAKAVRYEQREYFKGDRSPARLHQSKTAELALDKLLAEIEAKGLLR